MSIEQLINSFGEMSTFCGTDEYQELVRNNNILQTNVLNEEYYNYLCSKLTYYKVNVNFDESKEIYPEYINEIENVISILDDFLSTKEPNKKIQLAKEFHRVLIYTLNAIDCFY